MEHPQDIQSELQRIRPMLLSTARRIMGESDEAEDVVQDALLKLWTLRATLLRPIEPFATVLVRNLALNHLRRHSRKKISLSEIEQMEDATPTSTNDEKTAHLMRMLEKLPEQQRLVLRLHDMEGMDFEQIASITGTPATALRQQASRTRRHLRLRYLAAVSAVVALLLIPLFALRAWQYRQLEERYEGSYVIVNGQRYDDLRQIQPQLQQALLLASQIETDINQQTLIRQAEADVLQRISDPAERKHLEQLLNE